MNCERTSLQCGVCCKLAAVNARQERNQVRVASSKRLSSHDIARSDYVEAEVRVYSLVGVIVGSIGNPDSQIGGSLLPRTCTT